MRLEQDAVVEIVVSPNDLHLVSEQAEILRRDALAIAVEVVDVRDARWSDGRIRAVLPPENSMRCRSTSALTASRGFANPGVCTTSRGTWLEARPPEPTADPVLLVALHKVIAAAESEATDRPARRTRRGMERSLTGARAFPSAGVSVYNFQSNRPSSTRSGCIPHFDGRFMRSETVGFGQGSGEGMSLSFLDKTQRWLILPPCPPQPCPAPPSTE